MILSTQIALLQTFNSIKWNIVEKYKFKIYLSYIHYHMDWGKYNNLLKGLSPSPIHPDINPPGLLGSKHKLPN